MTDNAGFGIFPRDLLGKLTTHEMAVFVALTSRMDHATGQCWPSHAKIAKDTGLGVTSVKKALSGLREMGEVAWTERATQDGGQTSNMITLVRYAGRSLATTPQSPGDYPPVATRLRTRAIELEPENKNIPSPVGDGEFDAWWALYPRKVGKPAALKAYKRALKAGATPQDLMDGLNRYLPGLMAEEKRFIPHPSTWLNQGRYGDEDVLTPAEVKGDSVSVYETQAQRNAEAGFVPLLKRVK